MSDRAFRWLAESSFYSHRLAPTTSMGSIAKPFAGHTPAPRLPFVGSTVGALPPSRDPLHEQTRDDDEEHEPVADEKELSTVVCGVVVGDGTGPLPARDGPEQGPVVMHDVG